MKLSSVFFDVGGTLETYRSTPEICFESTALIRKCLEKAGIRMNMDDSDLCQRITSGMSAYQGWNRSSHIELPSEQIWRQYIFNNLNLDEIALNSIAEELSFIHETSFFVREMRPEIPAVLTQIQSMGLRIGAISNTHSLTQVHETLKRYGIEGYFSPIVLSSQYGIRKPDPSIFYHAARLASLPTGSIIYVGDKVNRDIVGAKRSGFRKAIQISHLYDDGDIDQGATPDAVINNMRELIPILEHEIQHESQKRISYPAGRIRGIFFDAGNILYHKPRKGSHMRSFLTKYQLRAITDVRQEKRRLKDLAFHGVIDRHEYYEQVIRMYGISDAAILAEGVDAMLLDATTVEIIDGVPETLKTLREQGYILGIISDTATPIQVKLSWFDQAGFGHVFDAFISSKEVGSRKPDTLIYEEAFKKVGLSPEEAVFVGHKASELNGARKAGMATIAFNYDKNARADSYIDKFSDLLKSPVLCR